MSNNSPRRGWGPVSTARRAGSAVARSVRQDHAHVLRMANSIAAYTGRQTNSPADRERIRSMIRMFARISHVTALALATQLVHTLVRTRPALASAIVAAMWGQAYVADRTGSIVRRTGRRTAAYLRSLPGRLARAVARTAARPLGRAASVGQRSMENLRHSVRTARMY